MKKRIKRLSLYKETLRTLDDMRVARGGDWTDGPGQGGTQCIRNQDPSVGTVCTACSYIGCSEPSVCACATEGC